MNSNWEIPFYNIYEFPNFNKRQDYSLIIPVVNEGDRFKKQIEKLKKYTNLVDIIIADGGSNDDSTSHNHLKKNNVNALLVKHGQCGYSAQLRMALAYCLEKGYKGFICMDGNNKDDVSAIPDFVSTLSEGYDFVQGSRFVSGGKAVNTPLDRYLAIRYIHAPIVNLASGFKYTDSTNGFRAFSKRFILDKKVNPFRNIFSNYNLQYYLTISAPKYGFKTKEIPVKRVYPSKGRTPTKIINYKAKLSCLSELLLAALGHYNT